MTFFNIGIEISICQNQNCLIYEKNWNIDVRQMYENFVMIFFFFFYKKGNTQIKLQSVLILITDYDQYNCIYSFSQNLNV